MIELLLALSLLSLIMIVVASWIQVTAQASTMAAEPVRWQAAANAVLQLVHDDLAAGDFGTDARRRPAQVIDQVLEIPTRACGSSGLAGPVVDRYKFDAPSHELRLEQRAANGKRRTRLLLDDVDQWQCAIDAEQRVLTVSITSGEDRAVTRSYVLR